jgi:hypothetical protein
MALDPAGIDKYIKKIMIAAIRDPDLFRVGNQFRPHSFPWDQFRSELINTTTKS